MIKLYIYMCQLSFETPLGLKIIKPKSSRGQSYISSRGLKIEILNILKNVNSKEEVIYKRYNSALYC